MQAKNTDKDAKDSQSRADKQQEDVPAPKVQSVPRPHGCMTCTICMKCMSESRHA